MAHLREVPTDELLSFQDLSNVQTIPAPAAQFNNEVNIDVDILDEKKPKDDVFLTPYPDSDLDGTETETTGNKSFWTFEYYQQFFDVDTKDVLDRLMVSIIPRSSTTYKVLRNKPDLYGPFWISVTLIFTIAISGNITSYLQSVNSQYHWKYDFHLVSYAATTICSYITLIPLGLWLLLRYSSNSSSELSDQVKPQFLELITVYGYSLFIYIPISILWTIQVKLIQWSLVGVAAVLSTAVLILTLLPTLRASKHKVFFILGVTLLHVLLALSFMQFFFHGPSDQETVIVSNSIHNVTTIIKVNNGTHV